MQKLISNLIKSRAVPKHSNLAKCLIIFLVSCLTLVGCVSQQVSRNQVSLASDIQMELMSPASFGKSISIMQSAEITVEGEKHQLIFQTEIQADKIVMVGLMLSGTRLFSLVFDGVKIESEGYSSLIEKIQPGYLLADMQISLWPFLALKEHLKNTSGCFQKMLCRIELEQDGLGRRITKSDTEVLTVIFQNENSFKFRHNLRNYEIALTTLSKESL